MLTASEEFEQFLRGLADRDFGSFCEQLGVIFMGENDSPKITMKFKRGNMRAAIYADWHTARNKFIEFMLGFKHTDRPFFDLACRNAEIQTDDARKLDRQRMASEAEADAAKSAKVSATAATASEKHAATSNRIAIKANRFSLLSLIVAAGALAVAIWALLKE